MREQLEERREVGQTTGRLAQLVRCGNNSNQVQCPLSRTKFSFQICVVPKEYQCLYEVVGWFALLQCKPCSFPFIKPCYNVKMQVWCSGICSQCHLLTWEHGDQVVLLDMSWSWSWRVFLVKGLPPISIRETRFLHPITSIQLPHAAKDHHKKKKDRQPGGRRVRRKGNIPCNITGLKNHGRQQQEEKATGFSTILESPNIEDFSSDVFQHFRVAESCVLPPLQNTPMFNTAANPKNNSTQVAKPLGLEAS